MPGNFGGDLRPFDFSGLEKLGTMIGKYRKDQQMQSALSSLGPNASMQDLAVAMQGIDPELSLKARMAGAKTVADPVAQAGAIARARAEATQSVKDETANRDKAAQKNTISSDLLDVSGAIHDLDQRGALVDPDKPNTWQNVANYGRATGLGQSVEGMLGRPEQASRDLISQIQPGLMSKIRQATQQGARGLDSNIELQFYMKQVGDVKAGKMVNYSAMDRLDRAYGDGKLLDTLREKGAINQDEYNKIRRHHFSLPGGVKETDLSTSYDAAQEAPPAADKWEKGKEYTNSKGQKAIYLGNGKFQAVQ